MCYTEKAPNAWQRRGTQKTRNIYNQPNRPNRQTSQTKHQAPKGQPGRRITPINTAAVHASAQQQPTISTHTRQGHYQIFSQRLRVLCHSNSATPKAPQSCTSAALRPSHLAAAPPCEQRTTSQRSSASLHQCPVRATQQGRLATLGSRIPRMYRRSRSGCSRPPCFRMPQPAFPSLVLVK